MVDDGPDRAPTQNRNERPGPADDGGPPGLSAALLRYITVVSVGGPAIAAAVAVAKRAELTTAHLLPAAVVLAFGTIAVRFPLQLRFQTMVSLTSAVFLMAIFGLPAALPGALAVATIWIGHIGRQTDRMEVAFDAGQYGVSVSAGAVVFSWLDTRSWLLPDFDPLGNAPAIALTATFCFLLNYALVSIAAAMQRARNPVRVWVQNVREDAETEAFLAATGVIGGILLVVESLTLPLLACPFVLLHRALAHATRLRTDTFAALQKLNDIVEVRDPYTAGHSIRVGETSRAIALSLGLTMEEAEEIGNAGGIHDVGKIGIDPDILANTGRLSAAEMDQMRSHPRLGADIVSRFSTSGPITTYVLHHHEWFNGKGYPAGLIGGHIPLGARIIAVADTFDALTSKRPYRDPLSEADALLILRDGAGTQWDTEVVGAFFAVAKARGIPLPKTTNPGLLRLANGAAS